MLKDLPQARWLYVDGEALQYDAQYIPLSELTDNGCVFLMENNEIELLHFEHERVMGMAADFHYLPEDEELVVAGEGEYYQFSAAVVWCLIWLEDNQVRIALPAFDTGNERSDYFLEGSSGDTGLIIQEAETNKALLTAYLYTLAAVTDAEPEVITLQSLS